MQQEHAGVSLSLRHVSHDLLTLPYGTQEQHAEDHAQDLHMGSKVRNRADVSTGAAAVCSEQRSVLKLKNTQRTHNCGVPLKHLEPTLG